MKDEAVDLRVGHARGFGFGRDAIGNDLCSDLFGRQAAAVVSDFDDDVATFVVGTQCDRAGLGLARGATFGRRFEAMITGIADHMRERILDQLQHLAVEFRALAVHHEIDLLAEFVRQIAYDAWQLRPRVADRLHARLHDAFLQLGRHVGETLQRHLELTVVQVSHHFEQLIARQHEFADHNDQLLDHVDVDADGLVGERSLATLSGRLRRRLIGRLLRGGGGRSRRLDTFGSLSLWRCGSGRRRFRRRGRQFARSRFLEPFN